MIVVVLRGRVFVRKHFITLYQTKTKVEKALNKNTLTVIMLTGWREGCYRQFHHNIEHSNVNIRI